MSLWNGTNECCGFFASVRASVRQFDDNAQRTNPSHGLCSSSVSMIPNITNKILLEIDKCTC